MLDDGALNAADQWVDDWQAKIEARLARTRSLSANLQTVVGIARSSDGLVEVTVDSSGALRELHLDDDVRRHSGRWIADHVLSTTRAARADLARRAAEVAEQSGDADTPEGRATLAALTARFGEASR
jgi:DNA-binding protein YbaB